MIGVEAESWPGRSFGDGARRLFSAAGWSIAGTTRNLPGDAHGSIAILAALTLTILCGIVGLAIDVGMWYRTTREMQNAADAAAIAAARDGTGTYQNTGKAVAARYGFVDGAGGITVTIANNQTCPSGSTTCYEATIRDTAAPQFFTQVLGVAAPPLTTAAIVDANAGPVVHHYCMLALAQSGANPAILTDGTPFTNLANCNVMSNTDVTCHGHGLNADIVDSAGTASANCGTVVNSNVPNISDPYASFATEKIPPYTCPEYYHEDNNGRGLPASNIWPGGAPLVLPPVTVICGDLQLAQDTTVQVSNQTPPGSVVVIVNGTLDLNRSTLQTVAGAGLTLVFTGTAGNYSPQPYPQGGPALDIAAPTSGTWSGFAIYLDPAMPAQTITYAGNSPTWNITGIVYMPQASLTFKGAVNKSSNGGSCFVFVVDNITIKGTGAILAHGECAAAGVTMPSNTISRGAPALVL